MNAMAPSRRFGLLVLSLAVFVLCGGAIWKLKWVPYRQWLRVMDVTPNCCANLRAIGLAAKKYQSAYGDWPLAHADWEQRLLAAGYLKPNQLICPIRRDSQFHYHVAPGTPGRPAAGEGDILLYEDLDAHWGLSGCVLYRSGHAAMIKQEDYPEALRKPTSQSGNKPSIP